MLIAIAIVVGVALLGKKAKSVVETEPKGQYSLTGLAATLTVDPETPNGVPTFTPVGQVSMTAKTLPFQLLGMDKADPSRMIIRDTFTTQRFNPNTVGMVQSQVTLNGDIKW